jgi:septal ring factor EnvC (AmiA/AmiB activator)
MERLKAENEAQRQKEAEERRKIQEQLQKQEAEKKRLEAELKAKQEAERAAEEAEKKRLKKLKNASDKALLIDFAKQFDPISDNIFKVPVKGDEAKSVLNEVAKYIGKVKAYIVEKAEQL